MESMASPELILIMRELILAANKIIDSFQLPVLSTNYYSQSYQRPDRHTNTD